MKKPKDPKEAVDPITSRYIDQLLGVRKVFEEPAVLPQSKLSRKQQMFLDSYSSSGGITKIALSESGVTRDELTDWKATDEEFKKAIKIVEDDWVEELRKMAFVRASAKSDILLMFLLKSLKPDMFDEDVRKQQFVGLNNSSNNIPVRATLIRDHLVLETLGPLGHTGASMDSPDTEESSIEAPHSPEEPEEP